MRAVIHSPLQGYYTDHVSTIALQSIRWEMRVLWPHPIGVN